MADELEAAEVGANFIVTVPGHYSLADLRREVQEQTGLVAHFKFSLGPTRVRKNGQGGDTIDCPIKAIDDPYLNFDMRLSIPAEGFILYVGYFKEAEGTSAESNKI